MSPHAVISGAGIGGPALAFQLAARGWTTTVLERFPQRRDAGQNVDIRGAARAVVGRMGIESEVRAANTTEIGTRFLRPDGSVAAEFPMAPGVDGPTAELEILRGELSRILINRGTDTDYRFDTQIADAVDDGDRVAITLSDGTGLDADLLVVAEGLRSRSRRFVSDAGVTELGMYLAYAAIGRRPGDDQWWSWQHAPHSRGVHLRPDNLGTTRAMLTFVSNVRGLDELERPDQIRILRKNFADLGPTAARILDELDAGAPMYFSAVGQSRSDTWSKGRITLLGDAAYCNATFGGAGTSLALIGSYVLAGELGRGADIGAALIRYQQVMKPFVDAAPSVRAGGLRMMNPRSRAGIRALHTGAALAAGPVGTAASAIAAAAAKLPVPLSTPEPVVPVYV